MNDEPHPNPYQPPADVSAHDGNSHAGPVHFQAALTEQDLKRYFGNPVPLLPFVMIGIAVGLLWSLSSFRVVFLVIIVGFVVVFASLRWRLNWKLAIKQTPRLLESVQGYLTQDGMFTSSTGCEGLARWDDIHSLRATKECVIFSSESWRLVSLIVPWNAFDNPQAAQSIVTAQIEQRKTFRPVALGDPRLLQPPEDQPLYTAPQPHVPFAGQVSFREIARSGPGRKLRRQVMKWLLIAPALLVAAILTARVGIALFLLVGFPMLVFALTLLWQMTRHPLLRNRSDRMAFRSEGWFCPSGFFLQSFTGQSHRQWIAISDQWHDQHLLSLRMPGSNDGWFFFSRSQFASSDDFAQACQWVEDGLKTTALESAD